MKLPLWRLICGFAVLGTLFAMLASLAPVYLENYRLSQFLASASRTADDDSLRRDVTAKATEYGLPVLPENVQIDRSATPPRLRVRYIVQRNFVVARLDLHLRAGDR